MCGGSPSGPSSGRRFLAQPCTCAAVSTFHVTSPSRQHCATSLNDLKTPPEDAAARMLIERSCRQQSSLTWRGGSSAQAREVAGFVR